MSEPTLIQQQRQILRTLRQAATQHTQITTAADVQWQEVQRAYEAARAQLAQVGEEKALTEAPTTPPITLLGANPTEAFRQSAERTIRAAQSLEALLQSPPPNWYQVATWKAHESTFWTLSVRTAVYPAFSPNGCLLASTGGTDKTVKVWEVASWRLLQTFNEHMIRVTFLSNNLLIGFGPNNKVVKAWEVSSGRLLRDLSGHNDVRFSSDGQLMACGEADKTATIWEFASGKLLQTFSGHSGSVNSVHLSSDGRLLASGSSDKTVRIWEVASGNVLKTLHGHSGPVQYVRFSLDSRLLLSASRDLISVEVKVWDVANDRPLLTLSGYTYFLASPDIRLCACRRGKGAETEIWDTATGRLLYTLSGDYGNVQGTSFSPDSRLLASGGDDKTVKVWEVESGRLLQAIPQTDKVYNIAFSPDGRLLAAGGITEIMLLKGDWPELPERIASLAQAMAETRFWYERQQEQIAITYRRTLQDQILARYRQWADTLAQTPPAVAWTKPLWQGWAPTQNAKGILLRLGRLSIPPVDGQSLEFPALLPFPALRSLLFAATGSSRTAAAQAIQSLLLRLLATIPPGKLRFTFIDPVGLGQNVAPFMHLADYDEQLVTARAWTESQQIEQRLVDLTAHMENVIQKYLRDQYPTIEDYNAQAGETAEPYRVLGVFDFPANFSETAARRLVSIVQNGPRCGVYAIVLVDTDKPLPHGFNLADLEQNATVIAWEKDRWVWQDEDFKEYMLELDRPPELTLGTQQEPTLFGRIIKAVGTQARQSKAVQVPFARMLDLFTEQMNMDRPKYGGLPVLISAEDSSTWWQGDATEQLIIPLGRTGARGVQCLHLSSRGTAVHALAVGRTGSGKTTLLHTLITSAAQIYPPDELQLYLVDFKQGVEFKIYATEESVLPHARVVAIESEREFGLSVLQGLEAEHKRRSDIFKAATQRLGTRVENITEYRRATGEKLPRILLIVDEFQVFFMEDDPLASEAARILDYLVRQGRSSGIHILLSTQTLAGSYTLSRSTVDQMGVRIALQCSEADSRLILADDNPAARLLSRPGEAIYNDANGLIEGNHPFQVAWLPDDQRDRYLAQVAELARRKGYRPPRPQIVFEGNAPAEVEKNRLLNDLLAAPLAQTLGEGPGVRAVRRHLAWLGDPIAIRDPIAAAFRRQSGSNLLIVGQNDEAALGMMAVALISLAAQLPSPAVGRGAGGEGPIFYVLDFGAVDAPYAGLWDNLAAMLPHTVKIGRRRQLPDFIGELAAEVQGRLEDERPGAPSRYLFLYGLQRARDLRQEEMGFGGFGSFGEESAAPNPAQQFVTILREGPDLGIHTVVWCDTVTNLNRSLDRRSLREFAMRAVFQMSAEDSANLIDSPAASKLGPYRALFYDEEEGRLEKFRPYGLPSAAWLEQVKTQLAGKSN